MLRKLSKNAKITLSILLLFIGLFLISFNYLDTQKKNLYNEKNIELLEQTVVIDEEIKEIDEEITPGLDLDPNETEPDVGLGVNDYIGYLTIDKIGLQRGFVSEKSSYNSIDYNIAIINGSTLPNVENGNFILASHSGSSSISYFKNLYQLELNDTATINYNNKIYSYKLVNIYYENKDGSLTIRRDAEKTTLTLITCTKNDNSKQTIYIFELVDVTK